MGSDLSKTKRKSPIVPLHLHEIDVVSLQGVARARHAEIRKLACYSLYFNEKDMVADMGKKLADQLHKILLDYFPRDLIFYSLLPFLNVESFLECAEYNTRHWLFDLKPLFWQRRCRICYHGNEYLYRSNLILDGVELILCGRCNLSDFIDKHGHLCNLRDTARTFLLFLDSVILVKFQN